MRYGRLLAAAVVSVWVHAMASAVCFSLHLDQVGGTCIVMSVLSALFGFLFAVSWFQTELPILRRALDAEAKARDLEWRLIAERDKHTLKADGIRVD